MKIFFLSISLSALVGLLAACGEREEENPFGYVPDGAYLYTGYDYVGTEVVAGWLLIEQGDNSDLDGRWKLMEVKESRDLGPQVGEGELVGSILENGNLRINLNPGQVSNRVILEGKTEGDRFIGEWSYFIYNGKINGGSFEAVL